MATVHNSENTKYIEMFLSMTLVNCYKCGIPFGLPVRFQQHLEDSCDSFYCPNGHPQAYIESTESKLRKQLDKERQNAERVAQQLKSTVARREEEIHNLNKEVLSERGKANYHKGKRKKLEARVAHGVCTCCNRTFQDLAAHMASKHPEQLYKR
jgi:hypothetical protein